jgi:hypothetical protein
LSRTEIPPLDEFAIEIDFMEKPRELFETELEEIRNELLRLRVRPSESLQQSSATHKELLEDWQQAGCHWLDRMQGES